jgi:hypothetical protein
MALKMWHGQIETPLLKVQNGLFWLSLNDLHDAQSYYHYQLY